MTWCGSALPRRGRGDYSTARAVSSGRGCRQSRSPPRRAAVSGKGKRRRRACAPGAETWVTIATRPKSSSLPATEVVVFFRETGRGVLSGRAVPAKASSWERPRDLGPCARAEWSTPRSTRTRREGPSRSRGAWRSQRCSGTSTSSSEFWWRSRASSLTMGALEHFQRNGSFLEMAEEDPLYERYVGREQVKRLWTSLFRAWETWSVKPERFEAAGNRVVVVYRVHVRGRGSQIVLEQRLAQLAEFQDGMIRPHEALHGRRSSRGRGACGVGVTTVRQTSPSRQPKLGSQPRRPERASER